MRWTVYLVGLGLQIVMQHSPSEVEFVRPKACTSQVYDAAVCIVSVMRNGT
jgi:hypothetical protein